MDMMNIATMTFRLHAPWVHSLKEKRMVVKSLVAKIQNRFHASVAEIDEQATEMLDKLTGKYKKNFEELYRFSHIQKC